MHSSFQLKSVHFFLSVPFRVCANGVPLRGQHSYGFSNRRKWDAVLLPPGQSGQTIRLLQEKPCWASAWYKNWKLDFLEEKNNACTHHTNKTNYTYTVATSLCTFNHVRPNKFFFLHAYLKESTMLDYGNITLSVVSVDLYMCLFVIGEGNVWKFLLLAVM